MDVKAGYHEEPVGFGGRAAADTDTGAGAGAGEMPPVEAPPAAPAPVEKGRARFNAHEWQVILPLVFIGYFINYDNALLTMAAPQIADGLGVDVATFGVGVAVLRIAALASIFTLRLADRWGRKKVLLLSVVVFSAATGVTALAWSLVAFVAFQSVARVFLSTEEVLGAVVVNEEMRPDRRGAAITMLGSLGMGGIGLAAVMLPIVPLTPLGWRILYLVTLVPLGVVLYLRRNLSETRAFDTAAAKGRVQRSWWPDTSAQDRARLWRISIMVGFQGMFSTPAFFYGADVAQHTYNWTALFSLVILGAAPVTLAGFYVGGKVSDRVGRKPIMAAILGLVTVAAVLAFSGPPLLFVAGFYLVAFAEASIGAARASYISELFPTEVRATLAAMIGALAIITGSIGLVIVRLLDGIVAHGPVIIGLAAATSATVVLLRGLPETRGVDVIDEPTPTR